MKPGVSISGAPPIAFRMLQASAMCSISCITTLWISSATSAF
jgi:hypothetical protein